MNRAKISSSWSIRSTNNASSRFLKTSSNLSPWIGGCRQLQRRVGDSRFHNLIKEQLICLIEVCAETVVDHIDERRKRNRLLLRPAGEQQALV
jgi:hypothetical protein